jgi:DNA-binding CsgD family transcriptional regulator
LHQYEPSKSRIVKFNNDDSLTVVSEYGYISAVGQSSKTLTPSQWRQANSDFAKLLGCQDRFYWNRSNSTVVVPFRPRGMISGALSIGFDLPQRKTDEIGLVASQIGLAISLYVNLVSKQTSAIEASTSIPSLSALSARLNTDEYESMRDNFKFQQQEVVGSALTRRQVQILEGVIEGKTNYEIASELGYSVSTVRQETMKIYQTLNVTGRRAAAQEALRQKIV